MRLKQRRSASGIRRVQPHSRLWYRRASRLATNGSAGRESVVSDPTDEDSSLTPWGYRTESGNASDGFTSTGGGSGVATTGGAGDSSVMRLVSIVERNSSLARRNSRVARPIARPSSGSFFGPKTKRAITMISRSSCRPMSNIVESYRTSAAVTRQRHSLARPAPGIWWATVRHLASLVNDDQRLLP